MSFKQRIKVLQIIPTLGGGGAENLVLQLAQGLHEGWNVDVTVVSLYNDTFAADERLQYAAKNKIKIIFLNKKKGFDISIIKNLYDIIQQECPDIVHTHLAAIQYVLLLKIVTNLCHVHTVHSILGRENFVYEYFLKLACRFKLTNFIALTPTLCEEMLSRYGVSKKYLNCIPNGVDLKRYGYKNRNSDKKKGITFISVASMIPVKNHMLLLSAFKDYCVYRGFIDHLILVGDGILKQVLIDFVNKNRLKNNVVFTGSVCNVIDYLYSADVFVLCSHYEGVSLALLEAAATGLPILATSTGGTPDVVQNDAILINDNNKEELYNAMILITENIKIRDYYNERTKQIALRHSLKDMLKKYYCVYEKVLNNNK